MQETPSVTRRQLSCSSEQSQDVRGPEEAGRAALPSFKPSEQNLFTQRICKAPPFLTNPSMASPSPPHSNPISS
jgi:hypothetical protein